MQVGRKAFSKFNWISNENLINSIVIQYIFDDNESVEIRFIQINVDKIFLQPLKKRFNELESGLDLECRNNMKTYHQWYTNQTTSHCFIIIPTWDFEDDTGFWGVNDLFPSYGLHCVNYTERRMETLNLITNRQQIRNWIKFLFCEISQLKLKKLKFLRSNW